MRWRLPLVVAIFLVAVPATSQDPPAADRPPNFIVILADDLGYGDVEIDGASVNRTPNLARMAAEGIRLTSFYATANWCMPTRASLLTGYYPRRIGLANGSDAMSPTPRPQRGLHADETTLPELLRANGYATAVVGKWHLGDQPDFLPTRHGFDRYLGVLRPNDAGREGFLRWGAMRRDTGYFPLALLRDETLVEMEPDQSFLTQRYTDEAIRFIEQHRDRPFFLFLSHSMPHKPAHASPAFAGRSRGGLYGDAVEEIDASTGRVLATLERLGLDSRTLVVFTSDNGAGRGFGSNAPFSGWKKTSFEGGHRVPFVARWPGRIAAGERKTGAAAGTAPPTAGASSSELVTIMDLMPTFARLAGAALPADRVLDGRDVWALLAGEPGARSPHSHFLYYDGGRLVAVRDDRFKLWLRGAPARTRNEPADADKAGAPRATLYDLATDVAEVSDVAASHPEVVERLGALAEAARRELGDDATGVRGAGVRLPGVVEEPRPVTPYVTMKAASASGR